MSNLPFFSKYSIHFRRFFVAVFCSPCWLETRRIGINPSLLCCVYGWADILQPPTWGRSDTIQTAGRSLGVALLAYSTPRPPGVYGRTHSSTGCTLCLRWSSHLDAEQEGDASFEWKRESGREWFDKVKERRADQVKWAGPWSGSREPGTRRSCWGWPLEGASSTRSPWCLHAKTEKCREGRRLWRRSNEDRVALYRPPCLPSPCLPESAPHRSLRPQLARCSLLSWPVVMRTPVRPGVPSTFPLFKYQTSMYLIRKILDFAFSPLNPDTPSREGFGFRTISLLNISEWSLHHLNIEVDGTEDVDSSYFIFMKIELLGKSNVKKKKRKKKIFTDAWCNEVQSDVRQPKVCHLVLQACLIWT